MRLLVRALFVLSACLAPLPPILALRPSEDSYLAAPGSLLELAGDAAAASSSGGRGEAEAEAEAEASDWASGWNNCPAAEPACAAVAAAKSRSPSQGTVGLEVLPSAKVRARKDLNASSHNSSASSGNGVGRIAVYVYSIGGYERIRVHKVPCVPAGVDAFLFLDNVHQKGIPAWEERGWKVKHFPRVKGTSFVKAPRLTAKQLKFTPPGWLLHGPYDWVVSFDMNMNIDLARLPHLLAKHADQPVVLLDWQHWQGCPGDGMKCFLTESHRMISGRMPTITTSLLNCKTWQQKLKKLHADRTSGFQMPYYYDMSIFFRHLKHPLAPKVESAFAGVYQECHNIERDQFVMPYYLWKEGLTSVIKPVSAAELKAELGHCNVEGHTKGRL